MNDKLWRQGVGGGHLERDALEEESMDLREETLHVHRVPQRSTRGSRFLTPWLSSLITS